MDPQDNQQGQERRQSSVDRINNLARRGRGAYGKYRKARTALSTARTTFAAARAGAAAVQGAVSAASNPAGVVAIVIIIIILTLLIVILGGGGTSGSQDIEQGELLVPLPKGVTVEVDSPDVDNNSNISYNIKVTIDSSFDGDVNDLILTFVITYEHSFISDAPNNDGTRQGALGKAYIWNFSSNPQADNVFDFELVVDPTQSDFIAEAKLAVATYIPNLDEQVSAPAPNPGDGGLMAGADSPPSDKTCGQYGGYMNAIKADFPNIDNRNFGDPICNFTRPKLRQLIEQTESARHKNLGYVDFWMDIARCESSTTPTHYDIANKAWGIFQMGRSRPRPFDQPQTKVNDNGLPRGDVTWQNQVRNAISWNDFLNSQQYARIYGSTFNFGYWEAAYCLCSAARHKNKSYCDDIRSKKLDKVCQYCN